MKIVLNITKKHVYALLILAVAFALANLAIAVTSTQAYHPLQDIAKSSSDLTSVDANSNTIIDQAESAPWSGLTGVPAGFADNVDNEGGGQWASSGTNIYNTNTGNVGIGTTSPGQKLDVAGYVKGQTGLCIGSDCRTSWSSWSLVGPYTGENRQLIHSSEGFCFLTYISASGKSGGTSNVYIAADGYWYMTGARGYGAACVRMQ